MLKRKRDDDSSNSESEENQEVQKVVVSNPTDLQLNNENLTLKDIQRVLNGEDSEAIAQVLRSLKVRIQRDDKKEVENALLFQYLKSSPELTELFELWNAIADQKGRFASTIPDLMVEILNCNVWEETQSSNSFIARKILKTKMNTVYSLLSAEVPYPVTVGLKLLAAVVNVHVTIAKEMFSTFNWNSKSVQTMLEKKWRKSSDSEAVSSSGHVLGAFVEFLMSFVETDDPTLIQSVLSMYNLTNSVWTQLRFLFHADLFLELLTEHVLQNYDIPHKFKMSFFSAFAVQQVVGLYENKLKRIVRAAHQFLVNLWCGPQGFCDIRLSAKNEQKIQTRNKIALRMFSLLNPVAFQQQQELLIMIFNSCPDLFSLYFRDAVGNFEPKLSMRFLGTAKLLVSLLSVRSFMLFGQDSVVADELLPRYVQKANLTKGLLFTTAPLVVFATINLLISVFRRAEFLIKKQPTFEKQIREVLKQRLPEFQVLLQLKSKMAKSNLQEFSNQIMFVNLLKLSHFYQSHVIESYDVDMKKDRIEFVSSQFSLLPVTVIRQQIELFQNDTSFDWISYSSENSSFRTLLRLLVTTPEPEFHVLQNYKSEIVVWLDNLNETNIYCFDEIISAIDKSMHLDKYFETQETSSVRIGSTFVSDLFNHTTESRNWSPLIVVALELAKQHTHQKDNHCTSFIVHVIFGLIHSFPQNLVSLYSILNDFKTLEVVEKIFYFLEHKVFLLKQSTPKQKQPEEYSTKQLQDLFSNANQISHLWKTNVETFLLMNTSKSLFDSSFVRDNMTAVKPSYPLVNSMFQNLSFSLLLSHTCLSPSLLHHSIQQQPQSISQTVLTNKIRSLVEKQERAVSEFFIVSFAQQLLFEISRIICVDQQATHLNAVKNLFELIDFSISLVPKNKLIKQKVYRLFLQSRLFQILFLNPKLESWREISTSLVRKYLTALHELKVDDLSSLWKPIFQRILEYLTNLNVNSIDQSVLSNISPLLDLFFGMLSQSEVNSLVWLIIKNTKLLSISVFQNLLVGLLDRANESELLFPANFIHSNLKSTEKTTKESTNENTTSISFPNLDTNFIPALLKAMRDLDSPQVDRIVLHVVKRSLSFIQKSSIDNNLNFMSLLDVKFFKTLFASLNTTPVNNSRREILSLLVGSDSFFYELFVEMMNDQIEQHIIDKLPSILKYSSKTCTFSRWRDELMSRYGTLSHFVFSLLPVLEIFIQSYILQQDSRIENAFSLYRNLLIVFFLDNDKENKKMLRAFMGKQVYGEWLEIGSRILKHLISSSKQSEVERIEILNHCFGLCQCHQTPQETDQKSTNFVWNTNQLDLVARLIYKPTSQTPQNAILKQNLLMRSLETMCLLMKKDKKGTSKLLELERHYLDVLEDMMGEQFVLYCRRPVKRKELGKFLRFVLKFRINSVSHLNVVVKIVQIMREYSFEIPAVYQMHKIAFANSNLKSVLTYFPEISVEKISDQVKLTESEETTKMLEKVQAKTLLVTILHSLYLSDLDLCSYETMNLLLRSYFATQHLSDKILLKIFYLHEQRDISVGLLGYLFGANRDEEAMQTSLKKPEATRLRARALFYDGLLFEKLILKRTRFSFDANLKLYQSPITLADNLDDANDLSKFTVYDPSFVLPFFFGMMTHFKMNHARYVSNGFLGLVFASLTAINLDVRVLGFEIIGTFFSNFLRTGEFAQKQQLRLFFTVVQNSIKSRFERMTPLIASFLSKAVVAMTKPDHYLFVQLHQFFLSRPSIDFSDVPMFYSLFSSTEEDLHVEKRDWILKVLSYGARTNVDFDILKRRHVLEILMTYLNSSASDTTTKTQILALIERFVGVLETTENILKVGILSWFSSIICSPHYPESIVSTSLEISNRLFQNAITLNLKKLLVDFSMFSVSLLRHAIRHRKNEVSKLLVVGLKMLNTISQNDEVRKMKTQYLELSLTEILDLIELTDSLFASNSQQSERYECYAALCSLIGGINFETMKQSILASVELASIMEWLLFALPLLVLSQPILESKEESDDEEDQEEEENQSVDSREIPKFRSDLILHSLQMFQFLLVSNSVLQTHLLERGLFVPRLLSLYSYRFFMTENKAVEFQLNAVLLFLLRHICQKKKDLHESKDKWLQVISSEVLPSLLRVYPAPFAAEIDFHKDYDWASRLITSFLHSYFENTKPKQFVEFLSGAEAADETSERFKQRITKEIAVMGIFGMQVQQDNRLVDMKVICEHNADPVISTLMIVRPHGG